ncbi:Putative ribonuclease H protein [Arachis hypogaea]|nr:Putative ribonuclease H protein [Arachis hypogaea]
MERVGTHLSFLWLVTYDAILTNSERKRCHLTMDDCCFRCRNSTETTLHVLRDCFFAKKVFWQNVLPHDQIPSFLGSDLQNCLSNNLSKRTNWSNLLGTAAVHLWFCCNKLVFDKKLISSSSAIIQIKSKHEEYLRVMNLYWRSNKLATDSSTFI